MTIRRSCVLWVALVLLALGVSASAQDNSRMGPLAVCPQNPRYFQNTATKEAVYLTGSHTWANLVDIGPSDPPPQFDFDKYVDWMAKLNHNFMRMWTWELVTWDTQANGEGKHHTSAPQPYARTGRSAALDGKPRFDLLTYNPAYFERLAKRVAAARERGIYVSVMLFEGWGLQFSPGAWKGHPFNPKNNINGIDGDANGDGRGVEIHELGNKTITDIQQLYVRKVVDTLNGFDNVLYEISNENHPPSTQWQYAMIRYIKEYEKTKPYQHPVGMTFQYEGGTNQALFDSPADWISPNPDGGYRDDPPVADGRKVVLNDTDHLWGIGGSQAWVWKSFTRGHNVLFMDPYDGVVLGQPLDPKWDPVRRSMGDTLRYARKIGLAAARPMPELASTKYCLAVPGEKYLVFVPAGKERAITVQLEVGDYRVHWYEPGRGASVTEESLVVATARPTLDKPSEGIDADLILYLERDHQKDVSAAARGRRWFPAKNWHEGIPESEGLDAGRLAAAVEYLRQNSGPDGVNELMIIRNGTVVWKGPNVNKVHGVWSLTKSFTSTVLGLLVDDGKVTLDTPAMRYATELAAAYPAVTLRHFTTMTSGYRAMRDEPRGSYKHGPSPTPFDPCRAPLFPPGTQYAYWDSAMNEFGVVLTRIAGESMRDLFKRRIADPIGMDPNEWHWGDFGRIDGIVVNGGSGNADKHIFISARQVARLGHLFLHGGYWQDRRLISYEWVQQATMPQVAAATPLWPDSGADGRGVYGFNWWTNGLKPDGQRKWPGAPPGTYAASGYNNNDMFIIPEWEMVIVRLGLDETQRQITDEVYSSFIEMVGKAITDSSDRALRRAEAF